MTLADVAGDGGRKTLAKINRGEEVKLKTLETLANKLRVPITHFDPPAESSVDHQPAASSVDQVDSQTERSLLLRKLDMFELSEMLCAIDSQRIEWKLNVRTVDDETILLLEQFEDAVKDLCEHVNKVPSLSLRGELAELKKTRQVASLMEELVRHGLAVLGAEYVSWQCEEDFDEERDLLFVKYTASLNVMLSIEAHPVHERRQKVWQGKVPPRFAPPPERHVPWRTIVMVDGRELKMDPAVAQELKNQAPDASSEDNNAK